MELLRYKIFWRLLDCVSVAFFVLKNRRLLDDALKQLKFAAEIKITQFTIAITNKNSNKFTGKKSESLESYLMPRNFLLINNSPQAYHYYIRTPFMIYFFTS